MFITARRIIFKIIAAYRVGLISFDCGKCQPDPDQIVLGCETPTQEPAWYFDREEEWYNCPRKFVMNSALDFVKEYDALQKHLSAPEPYDKQSAKFYEAIEVFEGYISKLTKLKEGK